jgi:hypothetical protein
VDERVRGFGGRASFGIVCECDREICNGRLIVTVSEYEQIHSDSVLFFVLPGHEDRRIEQVVRATGVTWSCGRPVKLPGSRAKALTVKSRVLGTKGEPSERD